MGDQFDEFGYSLRRSSLPSSTSTIPRIGISQVMSDYASTSNIIGIISHPSELKSDLTKAEALPKTSSLFENSVTLYKKGSWKPEGIYIYNIYII